MESTSYSLKDNFKCTNNACTEGNNFRRGGSTACTSPMGNCHSGNTSTKRPCATSLNASNMGNCTIPKPAKAARCNVLRSSVIILGLSEGRLSVPSECINHHPSSSLSQSNVGKSSS